jgi:hypothetical protein
MAASQLYDIFAAAIEDITPYYYADAATPLFSLFIFFHAIDAFDAAFHYFHCRHAASQLSFLHAIDQHFR